MTATLRAPGKDLARVARANTQLTEIMSDLSAVASKAADEKLRTEIDEQLRKLAETSRVISNALDSIVKSN